MTRHPRITSEFLHIIVRGIGKQIIFEDNRDRISYLAMLSQYSKETSVTIMAYCLMENHVHLLVQDHQHNISIFMKKMGVSYASYFNTKYDRVGHLFQDRYKSENVTDTAYMLTVFRYILKNPEKAGIAPAEEYRWSSIREYGKTKGALTDTSRLVALIGGREALSAFLKVDNDADSMTGGRFYLSSADDIRTVPSVICRTPMEAYTSSRHDDAWALRIIQRIIQRICSVTSGTELQDYQRADRNAAIKKLREKGVTIRQLERLTGISRGILQKIR